VGLVFFSWLKDKPIVVRLIGEGRVLLCTRGEKWIFESVVTDLLPTQGYGSQVFMGEFGMEKPSQQTLNCALSVDLF
jgi:hypothetical protein